MVTTNRPEFYERMKENARQKNAGHAFGFWSGAIASEVLRLPTPYALDRLAAWAGGVNFIQSCLAGGASGKHRRFVAQGVEMFNDLYGEDGIEPEPKREGVYCRNCDDFIERKEMKRWVKDDDTVDLLCPGRDETLIEDV